MSLAVYAIKLSHNTNDGHKILVHCKNMQGLKISLALRHWIHRARSQFYDLPFITSFHTYIHFLVFLLSYPITSGLQPFWIIIWIQKCSKPFVHENCVVTIIEVVGCVMNCMEFCS